MCMGVGVICEKQESRGCHKIEQQTIIADRAARRVLMRK